MNIYIPQLDTLIEEIRELNNLVEELIDMQLKETNPAYYKLKKACDLLIEEEEAARRDK